VAHSLGWLFNPEAQQVEIYRQNQPVEIIFAPSELSGEGVLPGFYFKFSLVVAIIFENSDFFKKSEF
jgi:Uma2 family endonuclease